MAKLHYSALVSSRSSVTACRSPGPASFSERAKSQLLLVRTVFQSYTSSFLPAATSSTSVDRVPLFSSLH